MDNSDFTIGPAGVFVVAVSLALVIAAVYVELAVMNQW